MSENKHNIIQNLSAFQRILLITDGTLTDILEAYLLEKIQVIKLSQKLVSLEEDILPLGLKKGNKALMRKILLQGKRSKRNLIYAETIIVPERLSGKLREGLSNSKKPLGQLWLEQRVETFKEIIDSGKEPAKELSSHFNIGEEQNLLFRTYNVFSGHRPIMMITEKFPESYFSEGL